LAILAQGHINHARNTADAAMQPHFGGGGLGTMHTQGGKVDGLIGSYFKFDLVVQWETLTHLL
jgi:hypothetical protein